MDMTQIESSAARVHAVIQTPEVATNTVYRYIVALYKAGNIVTQALICQATGLHRSTVSRQVNKLAKLNFILIRREGRTTILQPKEA